MLKKKVNTLSNEKRGLEELVKKLLLEKEMKKLNINKEDENFNFREYD